MLEFFESRDEAMTFDPITAPPVRAHRKIKRLYEYWLSRAPAMGMLPARHHIDPTEIGELLENIWLVDVAGEPPQFRIRLLGGALVRAGILAKIGDAVESVLPNDTARQQALEEFRYVAAQRVPLWFRGPPRAPHEQDIHDIERIFLPLAADGRSVNMLLCLTVFYGLNGNEK